MSDDVLTTTETETTRSIHHTDLTAFQIDMLAVTARLETSLENVHGLAIKESLEDIRGEEVNPGRLYPNLDELAGMGILEKEAQSIDGRTNSYRVTVEGFRLLDARRIHIEGAVDGGDEE
jgi:DNA-binding PadR family transcriptional regulator